MRRLDEDLRHIPVPPLDVDTIIRRGERLRARRKAMFAGLSVATVVAVVVGAFWVPLLSRPDPNMNVGPARLENTVDLNVYLDDGITPRQREDVSVAARSLEGVVTLRYVSKRAAFAEFKEIYRTQPEFWENLPPDALPARLVVTVESDIYVSDVSRALSALVGVDEVNRAEAESPICLGDGYCLSRASAPAGTNVEVSGPARGHQEGGFPVRTTRVEVWWNLEPERWTQFAFEGDRDEPDPSLIAELDVDQGSRFSIDFEVPRAEAGNYPLVLILYGGGGASHLPFRFEVTPAEAEESPSCPASEGGSDWTSAETLVASGREDGNAWVLCARTATSSESGDGEGLCMNWAFGQDTGSGYGCHFLYARDRLVPLNEDYFDAVSGPEWGYFFGAVPEAASSVEFVSDDGASSEGTTYPAPSALGVPFRFFTLFAEPYAEGTLLVRDDKGDVIREREMDHGLSILSVELVGEGDGKVVGYRTEELRFYEECQGTGEDCREPRPTWIDCGTECSVALAGAEVTLVAESAEGSDFVGWTDACTGRETCALTVDEATEVTARFEPSP